MLSGVSGPPSSRRRAGGTGVDMLIRPSAAGSQPSHRPQSMRLAKRHAMPTIAGASGGAAVSGDGANPAGRLPTILVAASHRELLASLADMLHPLGHKVVTASSPAELAAASGTDDVQLVIIDRTMIEAPGGDGGHPVRDILLRQHAPIVCASHGHQEVLDPAGGEAIAVDYFDLHGGRQLLYAKADILLRMHRMRSDLARQARTIESLEHELRKYIAQATTAPSDLDSFNASIAHDLHAPLRNIDLFNGILIEDHGAQLGDAGRSLLHRIGKNTAVMSQRVNGLLQLSAIDHSPLAIERLDISELCSRIVDRLARLEPERTVACHVPPGLALHGDRGLTTMLFDCLLANAWKFTSRQADARIGISTVMGSGDVTTMVISDNGVGFNMAYAERLFTPFQRLHASSEFPGIGIGLALAARIARKHGGRMWTESRVDQGSSFMFHYGSHQPSRTTPNPAPPAKGAPAP